MQEIAEYPLIFSGRVAHRAFFLDDGERTRLVDLVRRVSRFSVVKLLAYGVMSNHFASREYFTKAYLRPLTEAGGNQDPSGPSFWALALSKRGPERLAKLEAALKPPTDQAER